jgi:oxygen-independent coproporphyrinogen-3 oxidase
MPLADLPEWDYVRALVADLEAALPLVWGRTVHSVFMGGGTPSLFSPRAIEQLLSAVRARLPLAPGCEITLEANPGTFEQERFQAFRSAGVTRLSLGVQSFQDRFLEALGRVHSASQALAATEAAARIFDTFNLDLMYALPGQTLNDLVQDLKLALAHAPPHMSIYQLTLEPHTYFAKFPPVLPAEDVACDMLDCITETTAQAALQRYEVSAYAAPGHRCWHNLNYWQFGDYLGIGAGAHSKLSFAHRVVRQVRFREPRLYMAKALVSQCVAQDEEISRADLPFEFMLNALRLKDGFAVQQFSQRTGLALTAIQAALDEAVRQGLLERDLQRIWPSPRGFDLLNNLQSLFLPTQAAAA